MEGLPQELQFELKDENELLHNMERNSEEPSVDMAIENVIEEPEEVPDVVELDVPSIEKEPIKSEDIFITPEVPKPPEPIKPEKPVRLNKNGLPRKKRVYTEEQREAMRVRMKLAREQRGKNTEVKKQKKEILKKHKELKEKTLEQEVQEMEQKLTKKNNPQPTPNPVPAKQSFTREDLEEAQLGAIVKYETIRKQRKQKKKQEQLIQQEKQALQNLVKREMNQSWESTAGRFSGCY